MLVFINANIVHTDENEGYQTSVQIPSFFLDTNIQGITAPITEEKLRPVVEAMANPTKLRYMEVHFGFAEADCWKPAVGTPRW